MNEPHHPGPVAVVVDCPDQDYLASLLEAPIWKRFWKGSGSVQGPAEGEEAIKTVDVMCHLASAEVRCVLALDLPTL